MARFIVPSLESILSPNSFTTFLKQGFPGKIIFFEIISVSIIGVPCYSNIEATTDLPEPIPPVNAIVKTDVISDYCI